MSTQSSSSSSPRAHKVPTHSVAPPTIRAGLNNDADVKLCPLNSTVQLLRHVTGFATRLAAESDSNRHCCRNVRESSWRSCIRCELHSLFTEMNSSDGQSSTARPLHKALMTTTGLNPSDSKTCKCSFTRGVSATDDCDPAKEAEVGNVLIRLLESLHNTHDSEAVNNKVCIAHEFFGAQLDLGEGERTTSHKRKTLLELPTVMRIPLGDARSFSFVNALRFSITEAVRIHGEEIDDYATPLTITRLPKYLLLEVVPDVRDVLLTDPNTRKVELPKLWSQLFNVDRTSLGLAPGVVAAVMSVVCYYAGHFTALVYNTDKWMTLDDTQRFPKTSTIQGLSPPVLQCNFPKIIMFKLRRQSSSQTKKKKKKTRTTTTNANEEEKSSDRGVVSEKEPVREQLAREPYWDDVGRYRSKSI